MTTDGGHLDNTYDVVIVGAGLYGIQATRVYLEIHQQANLVIIEADDVVGGVWSSKRVYSSFISQTPLSMAQFADQPLQLPTEEARRHHPFCHAKHIASYLDTYVRTHVYNGDSIYDRILFNTSVTGITRAPAGDEARWHLVCDASQEQRRNIRTKILIDCTGLSSQPNVPSIPGQSSFKGLAIHQKDFAQHEQAISSLRKEPKHIVVLGGAKSAADVVYACATSLSSTNLKVSWVIRASGSGPAALLPAKGAEGFYTRFVASLLPCPFGGQGWWDGFLHRTSLGRWVVRKVWERVDAKYRAEAGFGRTQRSAGGARGFDNLESETPVFWQNDSSGINQKEDFWRVVAQRVDVYRRDIEVIEAHSVTLAPHRRSEEKSVKIPANVLIYCTGWSARSTLFEDATEAELSLPVSKSLDHLKRTVCERDAEADVLCDFPSLVHPPQHRKVEASYTPFRLYKTMAPVAEAKDRSILFLGRLVVGNNFLVAEVQALWVVAFLDGHIKCPQAEMEKDVAKTIAWSGRRYLNKGQSGVWFFFDVLRYADMLLAQLGLTSHRRKGWLRNMFSPLRAVDLSGLLKEYKSLYES